MAPRFRFLPRSAAAAAGFFQERNLPKTSWWVSKSTLPVAGGSPPRACGSAEGPPPLIDAQQFTLTELHRLAGVLRKKALRLDRDLVRQIRPEKRDGPAVFDEADPGAQHAFH
jgi:hypothetical protein